MNNKLINNKNIIVLINIFFIEEKVFDFRSDPDPESDPDPGQNDMDPHCHLV